MRWMLYLASLAAPITSLAACPGYSVCPKVDFPHVLARNPQARAVQAQIDATEAASVQTLEGGGLDFQHLVAMLGQALVFDRSLSVNDGQACALCHMPQAGFTRGLAAFARAGGVAQGAVAWRAGYRVPQSLAYAAFAPVLTYRAQSRDFAGGNLWDMRATGALTGSPSADQAAVPLTSAFEMALPDPACAVRRVTLAPYAYVFAGVWGAQSLQIAWPRDSDARCARPAGGSTPGLELNAIDRARAALSVQQIGLTIAAYEQSGLASPFSSKFDQVQAGQAPFSAREAAGCTLFTGRAHCASCHTASGAHALFTDFTSANIGVPSNAREPYLTENAPGSRGYVANPPGPAFIDQGFGGFLASAADTNPQWQAQAGRFLGAFAVPTLRNVAQGPAGLRRTYGHNGLFTSLDEIVHFFNTRDALPVCGAPGRVGIDCWPKPELATNVNTALMGNLGLSVEEEASLVAFLRMLNDGASP